jgi:imidazole glycerol-phosphate synthase subunit HisH
MSSGDDIVIINYRMGNLRSVQKAFESVGCSATITNQPDIIRRAKKIVLPGVGAFGDGIRNLREMGLDLILEEQIIEKKCPFMGICLGMQLICRKSYEFGEHDGLSWIDAEVVRFDVEQQGLKVPHVGWNTVNITAESLLFQGIPDMKDFYFVHSFHVKAKDDIVTSICKHGTTFVSSIQKENIFAFQFHPEKSQVLGLSMIQNFIRL